MLPRLACVCTLLVSVLLLQTRAAAQCTASNLTATPGLCSVELTWTPPPGVLITVVRWSTADTFASSTQIASFIGASSSYLHTSASGGDNFYWIVTTASSPGCAGVTAGPVSASPITSMPGPTVTVNCSSVVVSTPPVPNATTYTLIRTIYPSSAAIGIAQSSTPFFADITGVPGTPYVYGIFASNATCSINGGSGVAADFGGKGAFISQPESTAGDIGQTLTLSAPYLRANPGATRWYKDNVPVSNGAGVSGAETGELTINTLKWGHAGVYTLRHTTACGSLSSTPAVVAVRENPCRTDFDDSGRANIDDIFIFLNAWFAGCP
jgi:hypothetical protein